MYVNSSTTPRSWILVKCLIVDAATSHQNTQCERHLEVKSTMEDDAKPPMCSGPFLQTQFNIQMSVTKVSRNGAHVLSIDA